MNTSGVFRSILKYPSDSEAVGEQMDAESILETYEGMELTLEAPRDWILSTDITESRLGYLSRGNILSFLMAV